MYITTDVSCLVKAALPLWTDMLLLLLTYPLEYNNPYSAVDKAKHKVNTNCMMAILICQ